MTGPRQSGKTTLAKKIFPEHGYFSLENPDTRLRATTDPRAFLENLPRQSILDEIQNTPDLFSYLQEIVDDKSDPRKFVLTGSNSFQLNDKISQSLAGRIRIFTILPLTMTELPRSLIGSKINQVMFSGLYPRIYDEGLDPTEWFESYYQTYLQKDVKAIVNVADTNQFDRFVRLCAGRVGSLADYNSIASEVGVSQPTAMRWSSVLESSFISFRLAPHFRNFGKRIIKSPKLYFYDTGLVCQLLRIRTVEQLKDHPLRGAIFENFIIAECMKRAFNQGVQPSLYFWRDQHGHEIDLIVDQGTRLIPVEIKSGSTFHEDWLKNLTWFSNLQTNCDRFLVYGGEKSFSHMNASVLPWTELESLPYQ
jgi:predicted AAA+ superfamily ATPase